MTIRLLSLLVVSSLLFAGCRGMQPVTRSEVGPIGRQDANQQLIALDFTQALSQLPALVPAETTVRFLRSGADDAFSRQMRLALQQAGYGVGWVLDAGAAGQAPSVQHGFDADSVPVRATAAPLRAPLHAPLRAPLRAPLFQYRHEAPAASNEGTGVYEIAVGRVEMRRQYALDEAGRLWPDSPMYVRGVDASRLTLDDAHFVMAARGAMTGDDSAGSDSDRQATAGSMTEPASAAFGMDQDTNPLDPLIAGTVNREPLQLPLVAFGAVENVFDRGSSNFRDILARHRVVGEQVLTFANDSLRLGPVNKQLVEQMVHSFRSETDVFSVLGCSLGPTNLAGGNAALALGRASRVREALLFAGVPQDRILDEGCWAGQGGSDALPRRGVVLTLNRRV